ncbi:hypothetical protein ACVXG7_05455 [Enterobacter hormaechei]
MWFNNRSDPNMLKAGITTGKDVTRKTRERNAANAAGERANFKPASTSKIALLLPLNGQAAVLVAPFSKVSKPRKRHYRRQR